MRSEVFHYVPPHAGYCVPEMILDIRLLKAATLEALETGAGGVVGGFVEIEPETIEAVLREERIAFYMDPANKKALDRVCILLEFPDGTHLLADGNHRVLAHHRLGHTAFRAFLLKQSVWQKAIVAVMYNFGEN